MQNTIETVRIESRPAGTYTPSTITLRAIPSRAGARKQFSLRSWFFTSNGTFKWEVLLILGLLVVSGVAHGYNMFHFPFIENDEGTYASQAWAILKEGQLAPYTYWYDHAPAGWIQIAVWFLITGGIHTFGWVIYSGRVLMLVYQLISTFLVYQITRKAAKSIPGAVIATLIFSLSAFAIYFHRRLLLDNICVPWMLGSILLLLSDKVTLKKVWLSAVLLGISILSKEDVVFLIPVMTYFVWYRMDRSNRWFATLGWFAIVGSLCSLYFLYATIKGELFPTGTLLGGTNPHVSLLGTLAYQSSRGKDAGILSFQSNFWQQTFQWASYDPQLITGGSLSGIVCLFFWRSRRMVSLLGVCLLSLYLFLARGGIALIFYYIPLFPLLAIMAGSLVGIVLMKAGTILQKYHPERRGRILADALGVLCILGSLLGLLPGYTTAGLAFASNSTQLWTNTQMDAQVQAIQWTEAHINTNATIVVDDYMWTDLRDTGTGKNFTHAQWFWKVELDPAIRTTVLHDNWKNIDYVLVTDELAKQVGYMGSSSLTMQAMQHSRTVAHFDTGGWPITILQVQK